MPEIRRKPRTPSAFGAKTRGAVKHALADAGVEPVIAGVGIEKEKVLIYYFLLEFLIITLTQS
jgi:hypothetical protein